ncbi:helix-turn-helix domain-containing protein [Streptococcus ruminantium]|uniref:helix-turn-helix domain-containing protein n=1 Tax=Streptococcus ruminantium TaxID=1917441 RepID=UPI0012DC8A53|nr:helix-turn-helix domain-containing protein [Streptococcus ruminantium]
MTQEVDKKILGQRIKAIRLDRGMTLEEFGKLFGTSKSIVSRWESGISSPNPERLKTIAKVGDMTVSQLLHGEQGGSHYNWEAIEEMLVNIFNGQKVDKIALKDTQKIIDKAFFLNFGIEEIINIYMFQGNTETPLKNLEDLQNYFEQTAEGLSSYLENSIGDSRLDLEVQIAFAHSYANKINRYLKTGDWSSDILANLKEKHKVK